MRSFFIFALVILIASNQIFGQTDIKSFSTMSFFYVDNSSDATHPGLNSNIKKHLKNKLKECTNLHDNYFYLFAANGENPISETKLINLTESNVLTDYLVHPSVNANYESDNKKLQIQFTKSTPVKINDTLKVFLFLSYNAVNRMIAQINDMPTPIVFPTELSSYINREKMVRARIFIVADKDLKLKYRTDQIVRCFLFNDNDTYIHPIVEFE